MAFVTSNLLPRTGLSHAATAVCAKSATTNIKVLAPPEIQAAKHVQFKAAKKKNRLRPKKHRPSDINRKPPPYNVEPLLAEGLPEAYTIIPKSQIVEAADTLEVTSSATVTSEEIQTESTAGVQPAAEASEEPAAESEPEAEETEPSA